MQKSKINFRETMLWGLILLLTGAAFWGTYSFHLASSIKAIVWVFWFLITLGLGYLTAQGKRAFSFAKESKIEMQKVVWPTRQETIQTTSIVMIMVTVTGVLLWMLDSLMIWAIGKITHLG